MLSRSYSVSFLVLSSTVASVTAHIGGYHKSMFCRNGLSNEEMENNNEVSNPKYNVSFDNFWFHGKCKDYPPEDGEFLEIPAGGKATLELAGNRGQTTLSFDGNFTGLWPDGKDHSIYDDPSWNNSCIWDPNLHTENRTRAAGTVLAIAYKSDIHDVKYQDLVVMSVAEQTPWYRVTDYEIPADLPACPEAGCICAYAWIPNHCGVPNEYMNGFRCKVTNARPDAPKVAKAQPAKWCEGKPAECQSGAKGITIFGQTSGNTIDLTGMYQADTQEASPGYGEKMGFRHGAQNDIFERATANSPSTSVPTASAPVPRPTDGCAIGKETYGRHRRHQRRLVSFAGFHLSMDG